MKNKRTSTWVIILCLLIIVGVLIWVTNPVLVLGSESEKLKWTLVLLCVCLFLLFVDGLSLFGLGKLASLDFFNRFKSNGGSVVTNTPVAGRKKAAYITHLRARHGLLWRNKIRILLVVGESTAAEAIAPGLTTQQWLEGQGTLLLWGGGVQAEPDEAWLLGLRKMRRRRPLDGVVWVMNEQQSAQAGVIDQGCRQLQKRGQILKQQAPVYLWQVCDSAWQQDDRITQPVGCLFPEKNSPEKLAASLQKLVAPLRQRGMTQVLLKNSHDFLLRLANRLEHQGITHWQQALTPLLREYASALSLRGLMFSLPLAAKSGVAQHGWLPDVAWQGVLSDNSARTRRVGFSWEQSAYYAVMVLALLWLTGSVVSFFSNRSQIATVRDQVDLLNKSNAKPMEQLVALQLFGNTLGQLQYRAAHSVPWYQRFGLSQNDALEDALWPHYDAANQRLIREQAAAELHKSLSELAALPPDSPQRAKLAQAGYDCLKAYLMMANPDKADASFLTRVLGANEPTRLGVGVGLWQGIAPGLWMFYAENLPSHPEWRIKPDQALVAQVRQVLLNQIGQRNAEATLYQKMLQSVAQNYADMGLAQMVGDTDAQSLFATEQVVPGMFTRQAWEGQVQKAIDDAVSSRREEIDWVLSDNKHPASGDVSPEALKARLTERYFTDFSGAWLDFLNSLHWKKAQNLSDVTDQLTLMSDVRQSPLIALLNTLAYQGQTGQRSEALSDSLMKSAQNLLHKEKAPVIDQRVSGPTGPLDSTFGPLLSLMGKGAGANGVMNADSSLSLQTFLTRVTRVRLKLQQVANASDPQQMTQQMAQTVFQGKTVDLTETQDYGSLMAASLGEEWSGFGREMFVQPLTQAWQTVLQPSSASLNTQWQTSIVANWNSAFAGRYPFASSGNDASLPMLGQFIRSNSGRIEQFLTRQLAGVLHKEGNTWVPDQINSQGLQFNPEFLQAINQLSQLADVLFTDGSQGVHFELRAQPARNVVETQLAIDGQRLRYFNQMESWQSFNWPGATYQPGVMLTWTSINAGARLFGDYQGSWGLIHWLEKAKVSKLDESSYRLAFDTPDGLTLSWILRTQLGSGPLALLKLRGFSLPSKIFIVNAGATDPMSMMGNNNALGDE
ncbi:type VI secretion protein VasK [Hafnia paralvei]|uniref:ImcF-related family protein n=1 Tax=Hafnia paralvei TaxID=546367 RepID=UPI001033C183|nr:ImcF-related family protein [Hafnia paralvei]TBL99744.1 type VI secretion protein VasK [Hafnia paralvei]